MSNLSPRASRTARAVVSGTVVAVLSLSLLAGTALAGKPGGSSTSSTLRLVMVDSADTSVNQGDEITFAVSSSYAYPVVSVTCTQAGTVVYGDSRPLYQPNAFNDPGIFTLSSMAWTDGAASCTAALRVQKKNGVTTVATLGFAVQD